jgi:hypothetical protein
MLWLRLKPAKVVFSLRESDIGGLRLGYTFGRML